MYRGRGRGGGGGARRGRGNFPPAGSTRPVAGPPRPPVGPPRPPRFASTKNDHMPTSKYMRKDRDERIRQAEDAEYLGRPPADKDLIQVTHVLPSKEIPSGLEDSRVFNDIRRQYQVYITRDIPNILDIRCESMARLQKALEAINWAIRDMRLSQDTPNVCFLTQKPNDVLIHDMIRVGLGTRSSFLSRSPEIISGATAMDHHLPQLTSNIVSSSEGLMALNKTMGLRVNFGLLIPIKRKKGAQEEATYADFTKLVQGYSRRGGAIFYTRLEDDGKAEQLICFLVQSKEAICSDVKEMKRGCEVVVKASGLDIKAEGDYISGKGVQLAMVRATRPEQGALLNWTVAAPDMQYDWSFRIDAWDQVEVPSEFENLAKRISISLKPDDDSFLPIPNVNTAQLASLGEQITEIYTRSWAIVPFKESNYAIKIDVTNNLKGLQAGEPQVTWGIELYAPHWEESVNYASGGRKDWGKELEHIWTEGEDLKSRLGCFMRTILEVQALLNRN
ncbi:hypothetical protein FGSG_01335 [Fusarium graminearum PH-1]|uniref:Uncharacterized protein n=2 Tax=Gibberella zeae TaxID=5518 RepID=I1RCL6_GIBZE|nr:hypothetical protein FGSG_01335 [Fusarium graminearum PH-1]ESU06637.1 hypothetical protein FGSG_01335 [Fusarium graminearum PH-1]EYB22483.1 hypothetical protein FG05_01335 [Fusarium graminearum]CAF3574491.1 unnamed protein product [Fusarium graminearum]CAF3595926.1 unnamed protein product [Fusarium graminearum]|eukprot:XP_011317122.1 hypothetical protein FGSG_01335 [Fusarium graminearum PH-1]